MKIDDFDVDGLLPEKFQIEDKWILSKLNDVVKEVLINLDKFELGLAAQKIYDFIWDDFCDWYIELAKIRLMQDENSETADDTRNMLVFLMKQILKLLHPFMPFITEEIWQSLPNIDSALIISEYPKYDEKFKFENDHKNFEMIMRAIKAIRNKRAEMNVSQSKKTKIYIETKDKNIFQSSNLFIEKLAQCSEVNVAEHFEIPDAVTIVTKDAKILIPMDELVDKKEELARLQKAYDFALKELKLAESKLNNKNFVDKAPAAVVDKVKKTHDEMKVQIENLSLSIEKLKG